MNWSSAIVSDGGGIRCSLSFYILVLSPFHVRSECWERDCQKVKHARKSLARGETKAVQATTRGEKRDGSRVASGDDFCARASSDGR